MRGPRITERQMIKRILKRLALNISGGRATPTTGKSSHQAAKPAISKDRHPGPAQAGRIETPSPVEAGLVAASAVLPVAGGKRFHDFALPAPLIRAIEDLNYIRCTPIQAAILPALLAGKDATGRAQTGTGKTAAFLVAILADSLSRADKLGPGAPRALVLAPTRELACQIQKEAEVLSKYCDFNSVCVFGGTGYAKQEAALALHIDLLVATPGRLLDFARSRKVKLNAVQTLVIDEADRMLDMGFIPDVEKIVRMTPPKLDRRTWLFSATLTPDVIRIAGRWTNKPVIVEIEPEKITVDSIDQTVYVVRAAEKFALLYNLLRGGQVGRAIVFVNRRDTAERLNNELLRRGLNSALLSGAMRQNERARTLQSFKDGKILALVATDVAGRGLHVENVTHVINYNLPFEPTDYVHRIGRTGRAGALGKSISFACDDESFYLPGIEKILGHSLVYLHPDEAMLKLPAEAKQAGAESGAPPPPPAASYSARGRGPGRGRRRPQGRRFSRRGGG